MASVRHLAVGVAICGLLLTAAALALALDPHSSADLDRIRQRAEQFHQRYGLSSALDKAVDNQGVGIESLYGTRNVREVLRGVLFRGGANNVFHRDHPRDNSNPLPEDGLENLCREGFESAVYLYSKNFDPTRGEVECVRPDGEAAKHLSYRQLNALDDHDHRKILELIRSTILDGSRGPIYTHCWNGWHAAGFVAATALIQFCGIPNERALEYWVTATDGQDAGYIAVKQRIVNFRPDPALDIPHDVQGIVCPQLDQGALRPRGRPSSAEHAGTKEHQSTGPDARTPRPREDS